MRDFKLKLVKPNQKNGEEDFTFELDEKATTHDLKVAFTKREGYKPDELRLMYQRHEGGDEPLEDTELLQEIENHPGVFLLECPPLGTLSGKISVFQKISEIGEDDICLLIGSKKKFEHYVLNREKNNLSIPDLKFPWPQNKLAVVEKDKEYEYEAVQYSIKNHMELEIRKNHMDNTKWLVLEKLPDGRFKPLLPGKPGVYSVANEMNARTYE